MPPRDLPSRGAATRAAYPLGPARSDLHTIERLCHLHLVARQLGCRMLVHDANPDLRALIHLAGLDEMLLADAQEPKGQRTS